MIVGVAGHGQFMRSVRDLATIRLVPKRPDRLVNVRKIRFHGDVVLSGLQDSVVIPLNEDLTGLGTNCLEMPRRDALAGNAARHAGEELVENLVEGGLLTLLQIVVPGALQQRALLIEIIGAGFGADECPATVEECRPLTTGHSRGT